MDPIKLLLTRAGVWLVCGSTEGVGIDTPCIDKRGGNIVPVAVGAAGAASFHSFSVAVMVGGGGIGGLGRVGHWDTWACRVNLPRIKVRR